MTYPTHFKLKSVLFFIVGRAASLNPQRTDQLPPLCLRHSLFPSLPRGSYPTAPAPRSRPSVSEHGRLPLASVPSLLRLLSVPATGASIFTTSRRRHSADHRISRQNPVTSTPPPSMATRRRSDRESRPRASLARTSSSRARSVFRLFFGQPRCGDRPHGVLFRFGRST